MSHAREASLTFFVTYLSPLMSEVYVLVNLLKNPFKKLLGVFLVQVLTRSKDAFIYV